MSFSVEKNQRDAWLHQIQALKEQLGEISGSIYFEFAIPRMGKRADVVLLVGSAVFVIEYKVGENTISRSALEQVMDYSLDIKNFHETSHQVAVVPILVATEAESRSFEIKKIRRYENLFAPMSSNGENLTEIITSVNQKLSDEYDLNREDWEGGRYSPTPTIIEAAMALYGGHSVANISRRDARGEDLHRTTEKISQVIENAKANSIKAICFVTGVPGEPEFLLSCIDRHPDWGVVVCLVGGGQEIHTVLLPDSSRTPLLFGDKAGQRRR